MSNARARRLLLVFIPALVACAPILADGFRDKVAAGCHSLAACQALHAEAVARNQRCQREYGVGTCDPAREDELAAQALLLTERRIQTQLEEWRAQERYRDERERLAAEEQEQAKREAYEQGVREEQARKAREDAERAQAETHAREEAERAAREQQAPPAAASETPNDPDSGWQSAPQECCRVCHKGKACGDSCISRSKTCHKGPGCACDG
jgi:hypothetical protein